MVHHFTNGTDHIYIRATRKEDCKILFEKFCTAKSTLRQRIDFDSLSHEELPDSLGEMYDYVLSNRNHFYRYTGRYTLLYLNSKFK